MSCCDGGKVQRFPCPGCCESSCCPETKGCNAFEPRIRACYCQSNLGCLDTSNCGGFRTVGTAATGACPGPCHCAEEEAWNNIVPPKPNCEWLNNFSELRRQWSDHARQQICKCCNCRPRKPTLCRPCLPATPRCSSASLSPPDCQERRLAGGANERPEETSTEIGTSIEPSMKRETGGGSPPPGCNRPPRQRSPCTDCSSSSSSWCRTPCQPPPSCNTQPCAPSPKPILKKRNCCQCSPEYCMCQPVARTCNCPPPIRVDARAVRDCICDCPSSPECACPPSEKRFSKSTVRCQSARLCCPLPRLPPGPKCCCATCQPYLPPPCNPCTSNKCQTIVAKTRPCVSDSTCCPPSPCRPAAPQCETMNRSVCDTCCKPVPPCYDCRKDATGNANLHSCKLNRTSSPGRRLDEVNTVSVSDTTCGAPSSCEKIPKNKKKCSRSLSRSLFSYVGNIGHSTLVPGSLALVSFILLILLAVGLSSLAFFGRSSSSPRRMCLRTGGNWRHQTGNSRQ